MGKDHQHMHKSYRDSYRKAVCRLKIIDAYTDFYQKLQFNELIKLPRARA